MKRSFAPLLTLAVALIAAPALAQNYIVSQISQPYTPLTGATVPTLTASSSTANDDGYADIPLPFTFPYYGQTYTSVRVDTNGFVVFDANQKSYLNNNLAISGGSIPSTSRQPHSVVAPWWADLKGNPGSEIRYVTTSTSVTIEFANWSYYSDTSASFNFQIHLESSGLIQVHYGTHNNVTKTSVTNGWEDTPGSQGGNLLSCGSNGSCTNSNWPTNTLFTIGQPVQPDLVLESVTLIGASRSGSDVSLTVQPKFRNFGQNDAQDFHWKAYVSADKLLDGSDQLFYDSSVSGPTVTVLGANNTSDPTNTATGTGSLQLGSGEYYLLVEADTTDVVAEFSEGNNVGSSADTVIPGVDYFAQSISNGPPNAGPGTSVNLTVSFKNRGLDGAGPNGSEANVDFAIYASRDINLDSGDQLLYRATVEDFGGGELFNQQVLITLPSDIAGGDIYWILKVDPAIESPLNPNPTVEVVETNNVAISPATTHITQADLQANSADLVDPILAQPTRKADFGQPVRFLIEAENVGDFAAPPSHVSVILSTNNILSLQLDPRIDDVPVTALGVAPNNKATYDVTVTLPTMINGQALQTGDYYFFVQLDSFNVINELNEDNNTHIVMGPVRIRTPRVDYATLKVQAPPQAAGGETITLARTLANVGTDLGPATEYRCYASVNDIIASNDFALTFVAEDGTPSSSRPLQLDQGQTDVATERVRLPGSIPSGDYYLGCVIDPDNTVAELEESNNAAVTTTKVSVTAQNFRVLTAQLPDATVGMPYAFRLATSGAPGAVTWSTPDMLPEGIKPLSADGVLTGTPAQLGVTSFTVEAHSGNLTATAVLVLRVLPVTTELAVTTDNLPPVVNSTSLPYQGALSASGGAAPYSWSVLSGKLPNGLSLEASSGIIAGTPKPGLPNGETLLTVQVQDVLGGTATKALKVRVMPPGALTITTLALPDALVGTSYLIDLAAEIAGGGALSTPLEWSVIAGKLPDGLELNTHSDGATGLITGTPTVAGIFAFTVQVRDADNRADTTDFVVRIYTNNLALTWAAAPSAPIYPGDAINLQITAAGGAGAKTYRLYSGELPPGLELGEDGTLTGTVEDAVTSLGVHSFTVEATDPSGAKGLGAFNLEVVVKPVPVGCGGSATGADLSFLALALTGAAGMLRRFRRRS